MQHNALMHEPGDDVVVVVTDVAAGEMISAVTLEGQPAASLVATEDIPLGHKVAVRDLGAGQNLVKYGRNIGRVYRDIQAGQHVHTQNVRSERWQAK